MSNLRHSLAVISAFLVVTTSIPLKSSDQDPPSPLMMFALANPSEAQLKEISQKFEITLKTPGPSVGEFIYDVIVPSNKSAEFKAKFPLAQVKDDDLARNLQKALSRYSARSSKNQDSLIYSSGYRNFRQVISSVEALQAEQPNYIRRIRYGASASGLDLFFVKYSENVSVQKKQPRILITAATHGNELITTEVLLRIMEKFAHQWTHNPMMQKIMRGMEVYFIPVVNPDGFTRAERYEGGRDPNRSYPYPENPSQKPTPSIEALMRVSALAKFTASMDLHSYGRKIMSPWGYQKRTVNGNVGNYFDRMTSYLSEFNHYKAGSIANVIYVATGSSADFYYWQNGTAAFAVEMGDEFAPSPEEIPRVQDQVENMIWSFISSFGARQ